MNKYLVPEEGLKAALEAWSVGYEGSPTLPMEKRIPTIIEAFIRWQSENPQVPNHEQTIALCKVYETQTERNYCQSVRDVAVEWVRRMYIAPEPDMPEAIKDLLCPVFDHTGHKGLVEGATHDMGILEAYRRGLAGK